MSKISSKVSGNLAGAIQEVKNKISGVTEPVIESMDVNDLLNAGVEAMQTRENTTESQPVKQSRKRKTKESKSYEWPSAPSLTHDEFCEKEIREAHEQNKPQPDFDFRQSFTKGDRVWFVRIYNGHLKAKTIIKLRLRTIYPRMMVGTEEKGMCQCIDYREVDQIFWNERDARTFMDTLDLPDMTEELEEKPKKKRKKKTDDDDQEVNVSEEIEEENDDMERTDTE